MQLHNGLAGQRQHVQGLCRWGNSQLQLLLLLLLRLLCFAVIIKAFMVFCWMPRPLGLGPHLTL
jgi:hypothetical protein